eukprot:jgi/Botrbrau1/4032/Bobra.0016s0039.1
MADSYDDFHFAQDYPLQPFLDDCSLLGSLLDDCLRIEVGEELFEKVKRIRIRALCASQLSQQNDTDTAQHLAQSLAEELMSMPIDEALPLARACSHYLNLTSIAETHHSVRTSRREGMRTKTCDEVFGHLLSHDISPEKLYEAVCKQKVEVVLTAHPTQVNRRTLQYKHTRIAALLAQNDRNDLTPEEKENLIADLVREITALWQTDELRRRKPTPLDEARGGLNIVEQSLWTAVPAFLRRVNAALKKHTGRELPINATPLVFGSWMGGDRDGNPNVTAQVTHNVACLARWMAADLYLREVDVLRFELSMGYADDEVWRRARKIQEAHHTAEESGVTLWPTLATPMGPPRHSRPLPATGTAVGSEATSAVIAASSQASDGQTMTPILHVPVIGPFIRDEGRDPTDEPWSPSSEIQWTPRDGSPNSSILEGVREGVLVHRQLSLDSSMDGLSRASTFREEVTDVMTGGEAPAVGRIQKTNGCLSASQLTAAGLSSSSNGAPSALAGQECASGSATSLQALMKEAKIRKSFEKGRQALLAERNESRRAAAQSRLSPESLKKRGMKAAEYHKTSIDALLHPRHHGATPYRIILGDVRTKLLNTRKRMEDLLTGNKPNDDLDWFEHLEEFVDPLLACYWSLWECGGGIVAEGRLLDLLRRIYCFGMGLMKIDLRQESARHTDAIDAATKFVDLGTYSEWSEEKKIEFLSRELEGKRPLIPPTMPMSAEVREVLDTLRVASEMGRESIGAYVISMASSASDVLAVELLKREAIHVGKGHVVRGDAALQMMPLRVVPLFETLSDLQSAGKNLRELFSVPWYRKVLRDSYGNHQEVMLGYSDSGKDAGRIAAAWALYRCQEDIVQVCEEFGVELTLFHGRGGTVGRGGGPMFMAIQSQPPGSVEGSLRITEQGEMVQAKFGIPAVAQRQLEIYTTAVLLATKSPPEPPKKMAWRAIMDQLSELSRKEYRGVVYEHPDFISYFRHATPEEELANLNIGSRPTRRKAGGGVETLRAIPWIFAWTQTRMVLPAWLGVGTALEAVIAQGLLSELEAMYDEWPFFKSMIDLVEMIVAKADMHIARLYEEILVDNEKEKALGRYLRTLYNRTVDALLKVTRHQKLLQNNHMLRQLIHLRDPFITPINILQVEVLRRLRKAPQDQALRDTLLVTINGIAAGMRNSG